MRGTMPRDAWIAQVRRVPSTHLFVRCAPRVHGRRRTWPGGKTLASDGSRRHAAGMIDGPPTPSESHDPPAGHPGIAAMFEECIGCKWTLHVLGQIRRGVCRPGALARSKPGLTTKVLGERLVKLLHYGVVEKHAFAEIPPRVEYRLTQFGERFLDLLDQIEQLRQAFPHFEP